LVAFVISEASPAHYFSGDVLRMAATAVEAVNRAERCGEPGLAGVGYLSLGTLIGGARLGRLANRYFELVREPLSSPPDTGISGSLALAEAPDGSALNECGADLAQALVEMQLASVPLEAVVDRMTRGLELARKIESSRYVGALLAARMFAESLAHPDDMVDADIEDLVRVGRERDEPHHEAWAWVLAVPIRMRRGDIDGALAASNAAERLAESLDEIYLAVHHAGRAQALAAADRTVEAGDEIRRAAAEIKPLPVFLFLFGFPSLLAAVATVEGQSTMHRRILRKFGFFTLLMPFAKGHLYFQRAVSDLAGDDTRAAVRHLSRSVDAFARAGHLCYEALAHERLAELVPESADEHRRAADDVRRRIAALGS
jgi:hypothetical protein